LMLGTLLALLLPKQYQSTVQLMPPDTQSSSSAMLAALSAKAGSGIGAMAGDLLGGNSTGALFLGILRSRTLEDRLVERFQLKKVYGVKLAEDARTRLSNNTGISEDHKSGIISLSVVDHDPARAPTIAGAYTEELERWFPNSPLPRLTGSECFSKTGSRWSRANSIGLPETSADLPARMQPSIFRNRRKRWSRRRQFSKGS